MMFGQITLPADLKVIETWEIPYLLTQARYPDIPRAGVSASEILGKSQAGDTAILEFSDSDRALLDRIWQGREDWRLGIPLHLFADYLQAFETHSERPAWNLRWIGSGGMHLTTRVKFDAEVKRDIADGTLSVRDKDTLAVLRHEHLTRDSHKATVVSFEDFRGYAKQFFVDVLAEGIDSRGHEPVTPPASTTTRTHRLKQRTDSLDPVIKMAKGKATDPSCYHSVWAALVAMAESGDPPPPLCGYSSDGIQYKGKRYEEKGEFDQFTKDALRKRMNPSAR